MDDAELLRLFNQNQSQDAFRQLVERHLPMVLSVAMRIVGNDQQAREVAQTAFTMLSQKAGAIPGSVILAGWLYNTTRNLALHELRGERRRKQREQAAADMQSIAAESNTAPMLDHLDSALSELEDGDRDALILRYIEDQSLRAVGSAFGISEDAARMRVNRALDKLRSVFETRGVATTSALVAAALAASATTTLPAGLASTITATALTSVTVASAKLAISMWNLKTLSALAASALLGATGTYVVQQRQIARLCAETADLRNRQVERETGEAAVVSNPGPDTDTLAELQRLREDNADLLKLRNEVTLLRLELSAAQKTGPAVAAKAAAPVGATPGQYITRDQLSFAGYASPETALESTTWAMMNGNYEQMLASLGPEVAEGELKNAKAREQFEQRRTKVAPLFKGMQILARKALAENKVELKVRQEFELSEEMPGVKGPLVMVQPMIKVGDEWKIGGSTRSWSAKWDAEGEIQAYTQ